MTLATSNVPAGNPVVARRIGWIAAGTAALAIFSITAQADEAVPQVTVRFADLNLSQHADTTVLYSRLRAAAAQVCSQHDGKELRNVMQKRACYGQALSNAVAKVDDGGLTALHHASGDVRVAQRATVERSRS